MIIKTKAFSGGMIVYIPSGENLYTGLKTFIIRSDRAVRDGAGSPREDIMAGISIGQFQ
jgi:hypothetical protein